MTPAGTSTDPARSGPMAAVGLVGFAVRHPVLWLRTIAGDGPVAALVILFGLNAVDELDRTAFGILLPEIRDEFGLGFQGMLTLLGLVLAAALALQVPIAGLADRSRRLNLAMAGATAWAVFSFLTGLATGIVMLALVRSGSAIGKAVNDPTHNSLLADWFPPGDRPRVYSFHRAANAVGAMVGPLAAGLLAFRYGWRVPFLVFAIPTVLLVMAAFRLTEPVRGGHERRAMGASEEAVATEEEPPSYAEAWRMCWKIATLRRIFAAMPFLAASLIGFVSLASLLYEDAFNLDERARGVVAAATEPAQLVGLVVGALVGTRLLARSPGLVLRFLAVVAVIAAALSAVFALAPNVYMAAAAQAGISLSLAVVGPGIIASLSLTIPPRARSMGFSMGSLWVLPGLLLLPLIGWIADNWGIRQGMLLMVPVFLIGGLIVASAGDLVEEDMAQVWHTAAARSEVAHQRRMGRTKLLLVRGLEVSYGSLQVLFGVDLEVDEGEIIALLGTNGAGKSTLLKAIAGVVQPDRGAVIFDGRDSTHAPPNEVANRGIALLPGGTGVFATLTVRENLQAASRSPRAARTAGTQVGPEEFDPETVLEMFPVLAERSGEPAGNLSGGQQQMLALAMAFLTRPRLLMIDELSLGLAPVVVAELLVVLRRLAANGVTILVVEQSVNVALTVARTAYFMEKGQIRFHGPTEELLHRPDILRSVFLAGAGAGGPEGDVGATPPPPGAGTAEPGMTGSDGMPAETGMTGSAGMTAGTAETGSARMTAGTAMTGSDGSPPVVAVDRRPRADLGTDPGGDGVPALSVRGLIRSFGGIAAVDDVSLDLWPGEILGLIGPNGAGKTTLFDLISGVTPAQAGRVELHGERLDGRDPSARARRGLGRSFQDGRLFPSLTVSETVAVALERWIAVRDPVSAALHLPNVYDSELRIAERVEEILLLFGLTGYSAVSVSSLSTGTRRLVDLACVVAHRPTVVLFDEPSSGIAQREAEALGPMLERIRDEMGSSLIVIEHDIALLRSVSDRMIALDRGRVIAGGRPDEVTSAPVVIESYLGTDAATLGRSGPRN